MGRDPKRQRLNDVEFEAADDDEIDLFDAFAAPGFLAIDMRKNRTQKARRVGDSWMEAALAMSSSIDEVSTMIQSKAASYVSSTDTFNICFNDGGEPSDNAGNEMSNADRSILETTVATFATRMAKQIDSLRQTVVVEGDHPFLNVSDETENDEKGRHQWASGPIGHRAGIASCLMQRLKNEIMDPMTNLTMQRDGKLKKAEDASKIAQNPLLGFHSKRGVEERPFPPAPWEIGEHDLEEEQRERDEERDEFINVYCDEQTQQHNISQSLDIIKANRLPPASVMQFLDLPKPKALAPQRFEKNLAAVESRPCKEQQPSSFSMVAKPTQNTHNGYLTPYEEEEAVEQMQRESVALLATYQHSDLEGVQKVERSMVEITQLLSRFTDLITEQQDDIFMIHDQAMKSKENVDKGQSQLVDAANRGEKSKHPMASFILFMAFLLLLFNYILP
jgi:hypothetical protein